MGWAGEERVIDSHSKSSLRQTYFFFSVLFPGLFFPTGQRRDENKEWGVMDLVSVEVVCDFNLKALSAPCCEEVSEEYSRKLSTWKVKKHQEKHIPESMKPFWKLKLRDYTLESHLQSYIKREEPFKSLTTIKMPCSEHSVSFRELIKRPDSSMSFNSIHHECEIDTFILMLHCRWQQSDSPWRQLNYETRSKPPSASLSLLIPTNLPVSIPHLLSSLFLPLCSSSPLPVWFY